MSWCNHKSPRPPLLDVSPCSHCYCMTKTIKGKCGKCGKNKDKYYKEK